MTFEKARPQVSSTANLRRILTQGILALGVCVVTVTAGEAIYSLSPINRENIAAFGEGWDAYQAIQQEWRPRVLSMAMPGALYRFLGGGAGAAITTLQIWLFLGVLATCAVYIAWLGPWATFYILGTGVGLFFGYNPAKVTYVYPWDLPALFIYALAIVQLRAGHGRRLVWMLPLGVLFKETAIVLTLALLFLDDPWRLRIRRFALAVLLCVVAKVLCNAVAEVPQPFFSVTASEHGRLRLTQNLESLYRSPVLLVNGGTLLAFLLLPGGCRQMWMLRSIAIVFTAATFVYGLVFEFRIWFEMIPVALWGLEIYTREISAPPAYVPAESRPG